MKKNYVYFGVLFFIATFIFSCSSSDDNIPPNDDSGNGILSFSMLTANVFNFPNRGMESKEIEFGSLPCSNISPSYIRLALKDSNGNCYVGNNATGFFELQLDPNGIDSDEDGEMDLWNNLEEKNLKLPVGIYTLEYFAVIDKPGQSSKIIYMSPRKNGEDDPMQFYNLVTASLPITINIQEGVKYNLPVEVLCFQKDLAFDFGFMFIEHEDPNPFYLCSK